MLWKIAEDPEPTAEEIEAIMLGKRFLRCSDQIERGFARLCWKVDARTANPDLFLAPFTSYIRTYPDGSKDYKSYLAGELWLTIRTKVLERSARHCECCGKTATQVHHRDYRPRVLRGDDLLPLVSICRSCHKFLHKDPDSGKGRDSWQDEEAALASIYPLNRS